MVYAMQCTGYLILKYRMAVHRQQIRDFRTRILYVSLYIENYAREMSIQFNIFPLYEMNTDIVMARK